MKVCPSCRKLNPDDALVCEGCACDLAETTSTGADRVVTMFGATPEPMTLNPLERAYETVSQQYGAALSSLDGDLGNDDASDDAFFERLAGGGAPRPQKPWEK